MLICTTNPHQPHLNLKRDILPGKHTIQGIGRYYWSTRFCTGHHFTQSPKSYALQCFSSGQTPQKCPFAWVHLYPPVIHLPWTHPTQHPKVHLDQFSRFCAGRFDILLMGHHFCRKLTPSHGDLDPPHLKHGSLGPPKSTTQINGISICSAVFLEFTTVTETDRQTTLLRL